MGFISVREFAKRVGCSVAPVYSAIHAGKLAHELREVGVVGRKVICIPEREVEKVMSRSPWGKGGEGKQEK